MKKLLVALTIICAPTFAFSDEATSSPEVVPAVTVTIRSGETTAFSGTAPLAASTSAPVEISPSNASSTVFVPADSALATLVALDATTTAFDITDLAYFSSFDSFLINCIAITEASRTDCFNWTYAINGTFPQAGIDDQILHDGDTLHLFFGPSRQTVLSTSTVAVGETFTATAQRYDLDTGLYVGVEGLTLGVGTANPDFSFTEIATSTSDTNGNALFTIHATGTFSVGIQEDFYFPAAMISMVDAATPPTPPTGGGGSGGGGGGGGEIVHVQFNTPAALAYLGSVQKADGSFGSSLYTDWVALALAHQSGESRERLRNYLLSATPSLSSVTDYQRHAMALMALGINPYSGTPTDYIKPILAAFDGTQIGDPNLDNDDVFGVFALMGAGYGPMDPIIQKEAAFILSAQRPDGSWDGSVDMTAAAAQVVGALFGTPGISPATLGQSLGKAAGYLSSKQLADGGWENVDSTSWVQMMINATNEADPSRASTWTSSGGLYPMDALAKAQQPDGGVHAPTDPTDKRVWSTSYAITAASGKHWLSSMQKFSKPIAATTPPAGGGETWAGPASSTPSIATTTPSVSTSTPVVLGVSTSTVTSAASSTTQTAATSSATTTQDVPKKPAIKKPAAQKAVPAKIEKVSRTTAPTTQSEIAPTSTPKRGFLSALWRSITSFVASLF